MAYVAASNKGYRGQYWLRTTCREEAPGFSQSKYKHEAPGGGGRRNIGQISLSRRGEAIASAAAAVAVVGGGRCRRRQVADDVIEVGPIACKAPLREKERKRNKIYK